MQIFITEKQIQESNNVTRKIQRDDSIDIAKAIGIILMIIGHCPELPYPIRNFIFSFHMPLFFIFSGYFYRPQPIKNLIASGNKHLLRPYVYTSIVSLILCLTAQMYDDFVAKSIGMVIGNGGGHIWGKSLPVIGPIWFLLALYWCKIFYAYLKTKTNKCFLISLIISTAALVFGKICIYYPIWNIIWLMLFGFLCYGRLLEEPI